MFFFYHFSSDQNKPGTTTAMGHSGFLDQLLPSQHKYRPGETFHCSKKMPRNPKSTVLPTPPKDLFLENFPQIPCQKSR